MILFNQFQCIHARLKKPEINNCNKMLEFWTPKETFHLQSLRKKSERSSPSTWKQKRRLIRWNPICFQTCVSSPFANQFLCAWQWQEHYHRITWTLSEHKMPKKRILFFPQQDIGRKRRRINRCCFKSDHISHCGNYVCHFKHN